MYYKYSAVRRAMALALAALPCSARHPRERAPQPTLPRSATRARPRSAPLALLSERFPLAKCLDGSPAAFYFSASDVEQNATKWVIMLQGGGECVTPSACKQRANTSLGSSAHMSPMIELQGIQSTSASANPDLATWNMLFIPYCSGDLHLGMQTAANSDDVRFAGHHIIEAVLSTAAYNLGLRNATDVLFTGESAGGIGCFAHADFVSSFVNGTTNGRGKTVAAPIGGFYFSNEWPYTSIYPSPINYIPWTYADLEMYARYWDAWLPVSCRERLGKMAHTCIFAQTSYQTISTPLFVIEAQTDRVVMPLHDGLPPLWDGRPRLCDNQVSGCPAAVLEYMSSWQKHMATSIQQVGKLSGKERDGVFHPACLIHISFSVAAPLIQGQNYLEALGDWMFHRPRASGYRYVDSCHGVMCGHCKAQEIVEGMEALA